MNHQETMDERTANLQSWLIRLPQEIREKLDNLMAGDLERRKTRTVYPEHDNILNALKTTGFDNVKAVIIGQDPYHEPNQAMGLSFSVPETTQKPPSLQNIFKEYSADLGLPEPKSGDLTPWARNGVLLLNSVLTVERGAAFSHAQLGWQEITQAVIQTVVDNGNKPIVFVLWGKAAADILKACDDSRAINKFAIVSSHPSPLSANRSYGKTPAFIGSRPFSHVNRLLTENGGQPVNWNLEE